MAKKDFRDSSSICCICLEDLRTWDTKILEACGHKYHKDCIKRWEKDYSAKCP